MDWSGILSGALGAGILGLVVKLIDLYLNRNKPKIDNADAAKKIVEGGAQAVQTMKDELDYYDKRMDEQRLEIERLEAYRKERESQIAVSNAQLTDLEQRNSDLEAALIKLQNQSRETDAKIQKDTEETQRLRGDYAVALKQIIRLEDLAIGLGEYVESIMSAVKKAGIELPLNGGLMDSVLRLKLEREQRGRK